MAFGYQQNVATTNKAAIPGDRANNQVAIYAPENFTVAGGTAVAVQAGGFVWRNADGQVEGGDTGAPLGFMERVQNQPNYDISVPGSMVIPAGAEVNVAVQGDFFIEADATTSAGATVYANTSNGAATLTSGAGVADTGFKTFGATTSGSVAIITKR